jgi:hypothetical protein
LAAAKESSATEIATREEIHADAEKLTPEVIATVHEALVVLAARCDGAVQKDGAGFSRYDSTIGKSLASAETLTARQAALGREILRKYRAQLPADNYGIITS